MAPPPRFVRWIGPLVVVTIWGGGIGIILGRTGDEGAPAFIVTLGWTAIVATLTFAYRMIDSLVRPEGPKVRAPATGFRRRELEREKFWLLKAIKELEFDFQMRKIGEEDFKEIAAKYRARAIRVMRELDAEEPDYRAMVERELAARSGNPDSIPAAAPAAAPVPEPKPVPEPVPEPVPAPTPAPTPASTEITDKLTCTCGTRNDPDAEFCKKCGKAMAA